MEAVFYSTKNQNVIVSERVLVQTKEKEVLPIRARRPRTMEYQRIKMHEDRMIIILLTTTVLIGGPDQVLGTETDDRP